MILFIDASTPPPSMEHATGLAFYIGGNTPHVWTPEEVNRLKPRYRLPIWVRSEPQSHDPLQDAERCLKQLGAFGAPKGSLVALDSETSVDPQWVKAFVHAVNQGGHPVIEYGSMASLFGNQNPDGYYWGADWTKHAHLAGGTQMTQFIAFGSYDESEASDKLPFWVTSGGSTPNPPPPSLEEKIMSVLPVLHQGETDNAVRTVQGLCVARGHQIAVDGAYGPVTTGAVREVQASAHIAVDGITGPDTWKALMLGW